MTRGMFVPTAAMKARMMTVPGSDRTISLILFITPSPRRLRAAQSVIGTVTPMATTGTMTAMKIVGAAAVTRRERRSRPSSSVPSRCASEGPCRTAVRSCSSGPYRSHRGAVSDARTSPMSQTSEMTAAGERRIRPPRRRSLRRGRTMEVVETVMMHAASGRESG